MRIAFQLSRAASLALLGLVLCMSHVHALGFPPPIPVPFCFGSGTPTACPCGHVGADGNGCPNSASTVGGQLSSIGFASISAGAFVLSTTNLPPSTPGLYFQGSSTTSSVFGNGILCAGGIQTRLEIRFANGTGSSSTTVPIHVLGNAAPGDTRYYQHWYRDDASYCPNAGFNLTNALMVFWGP